ncbi:3-deoxy-manno-octulosonate cytidylyltransferase [Novosphingobium lubricantis]
MSEARSGPDLIVVPARFGSTRLPGKPLLPIAGRSLLDRVVAIARAAAAQAGDCNVIVATDDARIADHAAALGVAVAMTATDLDSGTARAHAAARQQLQRPARVINLQGDAPFIPPAIVASLLQTLRAGAADVATPVFRLDWARLDRLRAHKQAAPFSGTTCIRATDGRALWFSKTIIPVLRGEAQMRSSDDTALSPVWQHLGLYGYTMAALEWFAATPPAPYETLEGLEQLRFLEHGRTIATVPVEVPAHVLSGIDTPQDLAMAEQAITRFGDPYPV